MLSAFLLEGVIAGPLATIALFMPVRKRLGASALLWTRRLLLALVGTAVMAVVIGGSLWALSVTRANIIVSLAVLVGVSLVWLPATRRWNARAHLCWAMNVLLFAAYLAFMLHWTFVSGLSLPATIGALVLWTLEVFAALLAAAYLWELCDAVGRENWVRRIGAGVAIGQTADGVQPFVSLHVPAHFEPPDMVIETLESLLRQDYPAYEVIAIDDNTTDDSQWAPVEAWCESRGVKFAHLENWPGYKSGALNYALNELTDPRAELIGVVDSDYQLQPDFLRRCAPLFANPEVGFIQCPQDYRGWEDVPYLRRLYYSYKYFFAVSQPSRNERNGAIFAGTMGLIRRSALERVGGWDEWCITEDAELSIRLLRGGWSGLHVDASFGHGLMPLSFEALKGQRFRWCFGGIQILREHWPWMLVRRDPRLSGGLSLGQRWAYLSGALQWYGDLLGLVFFAFLLAGAANVAFGGGLLFRKLTGFLVAAIPVLVVLGLVRAVALLRRGTGASWTDALGAFLIWQSTSLAVARASVQALFASRAEFLRTPKADEGSSGWPALLGRAVRGNPGELTLVVLGLAGILGCLVHPTGYGGPFTAALLAWPTLAFASAPINSVIAQRARLSPELARRRSAEDYRDRYYAARQISTAVGGLAAIAGAIAVVVVLLGPGGQLVKPPDIVGPARGQQEGVPTPPSSGPQSPGGGSTSPTPSGSTGSPTTSPTTSTTPTPSQSPTPSPSPTSGSPSPTPTPTPTTSSPSPSPTSTSSPAATPTSSPTSSSPTATATQTTSTPTGLRSV